MGKHLYVVYVINNASWEDMKRRVEFLVSKQTLARDSALGTRGACKASVRKAEAKSHNERHKPVILNHTADTEDNI